MDVAGVAASSNGAPPDAESPLRPARDGRCVLCREKLEQSGDHQVATLKCGHFFGLRCVQQHVQHRKACPFPGCSQKAQPADVQRLYVPSVDSLLMESEDHVRAQLAEERDRRKRLLSEREEHLQAAVECRKRVKLQFEELLTVYAALPQLHPAAVQFRPHHFSCLLAHPLEAQHRPVARFLPGLRGTQVVVANAAPAGMVAAEAAVAVLDVAAAAHRLHRLPCAGRAPAAVLDARPGDEHELAVVLSDGTLRLVDLRTAGDGLRGTLPHGIGTRCAIQPTAQRAVYVGTNTGHVELFDLRRTHQPLETKPPVLFNSRGHAAPIVALEVLHLPAAGPHSPTPAWAPAAPASPVSIVLDVDEAEDVDAVDEVDVEVDLESATDLRATAWDVPLSRALLGATNGHGGLCANCYSTAAGAASSSAFVPPLNGNGTDSTTSISRPRRLRVGPEVVAGGGSLPGLLVGTSCGLCYWWEQAVNLAVDPFAFEPWQSSVLLPSRALQHVSLDPATGRLALGSAAGCEVVRLSRGRSSVVVHWPVQPAPPAPTARICCAFSASARQPDAGDDLVETTAFVACAEGPAVAVYDTEAGTSHELPPPFPGEPVRWLDAGAVGGRDALLLSTAKGVALFRYDGFDTSAGSISD